MPKRIDDIDFPDPRFTAEQGLIAVGGSTDAATLKKAYCKGIFPWPHEGYPMLWFSPETRGVLDFKDLHEPRSFKKWKKKSVLRVTHNQDFSAVIAGCRHQPRPGQSGTWINEEIIAGYTSLFNDDWAYSTEIWDGEKLVGGLYGVRTPKYCTAESMFHLVTGASKLALVATCEWLSRRGVDWLDTQMVTSVVSAFGAKEISREEFLLRIGVR